MALWTAFLLGLVGSAHCAGMCGPLALALPAIGRTQARLLAGRLAYNFGRVTTYALMGILFGLLGKSLAIAGLQRWVSLTLGAVILAGLFVSWSFAGSLPVVRFVGWLKAGFGRLLQRQGLSALFGVGLLNGLLPCGLVYVACAGALTAETLAGGVGYMVAFGFGTMPMMLAISLAGPRLQLRLRFKLQRLVPIGLAIIGGLMVLRGLSLGIPYISPDLSAGQATCCHH